MSRLGRPNLTLLPAEEARRILVATRAVGTERVALADAAGRVLAGAFAAPAIFPPSAARSWTATPCAPPTWPGRRSRGGDAR